jgi:hypothetical protein
VSGEDSVRMLDRILPHKRQTGYPEMGEALAARRGELRKVVRRVQAPPTGSR